MNKPSQDPRHITYNKNLQKIQSMSHPYDQPIIDVVNYVYNHPLDEDDETIWKCARTLLLDTLGCAIETAAASESCRKLLGPVIKGTVVPNGFKLPGTDLQVDPLKGAFDLGVLIRYLDHNDALGGVEWGHPSGTARKKKMGMTSG